MHEGNESCRPGDMRGIAVMLHFNFFTYEQLAAALLAAGFTIEQITDRAPHPEIEIAIDRLYATATAAEGAADR